MVKVKLCGFTREEDIKKAVELDADYIGIVLYPKSPRYVSWDRVGRLIECSGKAKTVAVMVNPSQEDVMKALDMGFDLIQLHGEESFSFAKDVGIHRILKAFRTCKGVQIQQDWKMAHGILLDACTPVYGGSGQSADWEFAKILVEDGFRIFLAGGLRPDNVAQAITKVKPYAVDVSSGIEISPGIKDHKKMEEFMHAVKNALKN